MTFRSLVTVLGALAVFSPPVVWGAQGVVVVEKTTTNGTPRTSQVQMTAQRMRADVGTTAGQMQTVIFDGPKQVMYLVNVERKTYNEMTKADVDQMGAQLSGAMAQMQQMLASMPPEQRAQMEAMMKGRGMPGMPGLGGPPAKTEYKKGGTQRVGKWTCDVYEMSAGGQKTGELCTVNPQTLGFTAADFEVSRQMAAFMRGLIPQGADALFQVGSAEQGFSGVPVRRVTTVAGQQLVSELESVNRQDLPDSLFVVPEGFTKEAFGPGAGAAAVADAAPSNTKGRSPLGERPAEDRTSTSQLQDCVPAS